MKISNRSLGKISPTQRFYHLQTSVILRKCEMLPLERFEITQLWGNVTSRGRGVSWLRLKPVQCILTHCVQCVNQPLETLLSNLFAFIILIIKYNVWKMLGKVTPCIKTIFFQSGTWPNKLSLACTELFFFLKKEKKEKKIGTGCAQYFFLPFYSNFNQK